MVPPDLLKLGGGLGGCRAGGGGDGPAGGECDADARSGRGGERGARGRGDGGRPRGGCTREVQETPVPIRRDWRATRKS